MRAVWEPKVNHSEQLLALDKSIITEKHDPFANGSDHFATLINELSSVERCVVDNIKHRPTQHWMRKYPDLDKVSKVISILCDETFRADERHPKIIMRSRWLVKVLYNNIKDTRENLEILADWKDAQLVTIFKKSDRQDCGAYWGDLASLDTMERVRPHTAQQTIDPSRRFLT